MQLPIDVPFEPAQLLSRHVLVVGDSAACRVGRNARSVVAAFNDSNAQPRDVVDVECQESTRVEHWASGRFKRALDSRNDLDAVVVFLGTSHVRDASTPDVGPLLDAVKRRGIACVWVGNTAVNGRSWPMNDMMRRAVSSTCTYFDTERADVELVDNVHPTLASAASWFTAVWRTLPQKHDKEPQE